MKKDVCAAEGYEKMQLGMITSVQLCICLECCLRIEKLLKCLKDLIKKHVLIEVIFKQIEIIRCSDVEKNESWKKEIEAIKMSVL